MIGLMEYYQPTPVGACVRGQFSRTVRTKQIPPAALLASGGPAFRRNASTKALLLALAATAFIAGITGARADTPWQKTHPWREQVNNRLQRQNARIHRQVAEGELTHARAQRLQAKDRNVRMQERRMAAQHGGHLTKRDRRVLNRRENHISRHVGH